MGSGFFVKVSLNAIGIPQGFRVDFFVINPGSRMCDDICKLEQSRCRGVQRNNALDGFESTIIVACTVNNMLKIRMGIEFVGINNH